MANGPAPGVTLGLRANAGSSRCSSVSAPWSAGWSGRSGRSCRCWRPTSSASRGEPRRVHRRVRAGQGGDEPRAGGSRTDSAASPSCRRLARRAARALLLIVAPDWGWVVVANVLLGVNQGLTWSTTVLMKIDLVGPRGGLALGLNEAAGYLAVAGAAFLTGRDRGSGRAPPGSVLPRASRSRGSASGSSRCSSGRPTPTRCWKAGRRRRRNRAAGPPLAAAGLAEHCDRSIALGRLAGRSGQQPQRRRGVGAAAARAGRRPGSTREIGLLAGRLSGDVGHRPDRDGRASDRIGRKRLIVTGDAGPGRRHRGDRR